ncbi:MAG TPA: VOC family protein [Terriglobia bacterium]|nr:VOC family protein [Terriglobia bacterium]
MKSRCLMMLVAMVFAARGLGGPRTNSAVSAAPTGGPAPAAGSRPLIVGVAHIALKTSNLASARQFYGHVLGFQEISSLPNPLTGRPDGVCFKVNDHQYIEVYPGLKDPSEDRLLHIAFETTNARQLAVYLAGHSVKTSPLQPDTEGNFSFTLHDIDGHVVEFAEYVPTSLSGRGMGKFLGPERISQRIIHVGVTVGDQAAANRLYQDVLGYRDIWHGGMTDDRTDWVDMRVPDGKDWLEYMLNVHHPSPRTLGVMHHMSLGVPSVAEAYQTAVGRGYQSQEKPQIGRDGKWQYNLYDPDLTRVEVMEPKPVEKPCCSPILD